jgi:hypothetical protein
LVSVDVTLGDLSQTSTETGEIKATVPASRVKIHSGYNVATTLNDLAILGLPNEVTTTSNINFILPAAASSNYQGGSVVLLGWGKTETGC